MALPKPSDKFLQDLAKVIVEHNYKIVDVCKATGHSHTSISRWRDMAVRKGFLGPRPDPVLNNVPPEERDHVEDRRGRDELSRLRTANADLARRAAEAEDIRASVLGLTSDPLKPRIVAHQPGTGKGGRSVILHLSDVHYGESVFLDQMDGLNKYDAAIAKARLGRFFNKAASLCTEHWSGAPPEEIVLCLGGDLISGNIHAELAETNAPAVPATVREVAELIAGGILTLRQRVGCPVRVYSVPGNHGRLTIKPQSKGRAAMSLDLLATDFAEACVRGAGISDVTFYRTESPDAYFSTYCFSWLLTHGDAMGAKGGTGFIGASATIVRGHRKLIDTSWRSGRPIYRVLTGHFHNTLRSPFGYGNGSVVGFGEYARDLRADPEASCQNMLVVHEQHGVISHQELHLGHPSEGSLYAGPAVVSRPYADVA